jgi:hypothetical protein
MFIERGDELIDRYCTAIQNAERTADQAVSHERERTAGQRDQRSELAGRLSRILLDALDGGEDPLSRVLREVGVARLRDCVEDPAKLALPIDAQRREAKHRRHGHLAQFAPTVLAALDLRAARGYEPLLDAIRYSNERRDEPRLPDASLGVLPAAWRQWVLDEHGVPIRTRYELALWIKARETLKGRGLYRAASQRYGDPAGWLMPQVQWQREREELAAIFERPLSGAVRLEQLERQQRQLARQLQERYERDERVLYDGQAITGQPPGEQRAPTSPYAPVVHSMLPLMQFAPLLIDVHRDTAFLDELGHYGQGARSHARLGQLLAALIAEMTGMGFARMAQACEYTEKEMRHAARQLTDENLDAASARRVTRSRRPSPLKSASAR